MERPESIPAVFVEAWNERDADKLASVFEEDAEFVNVTGLWWHDRESIRKAHAYGLERIFNRSELRLVETRVKWLSDTIAVVHARMSLTRQTSAGGIDQPRDRHNIFSFVVRHTPQGWRCVSAHNTDVVPGTETNIIDEQGRLKPISYRESGK